MDWMPMFLSLTSGAFLVPLVLQFQREMNAMDERRRALLKRVDQCEANIAAIADESAQVQTEIDRETLELEEVQAEKANLEKQFQEVKRQTSEGPE